MRIKKFTLLMVLVSAVLVSIPAQAFHWNWAEQESRSSFFQKADLRPAVIVSQLAAEKAKAMGLRGPVAHRSQTYNNDMITSVPSTAEVKYYTRSGFYHDNSNSYTETAQGGMATIAFDGNDVYIQNPIAGYTSNSWMKGTKSGNTITFPLKQFLSWSAADELYTTMVDISGSTPTNDKDASEITYTISADGKTITQNGTSKTRTFAVAWSDDDTVYSYGCSGGEYITVFTLDETYVPASTDLVEPPTGATVETWYAEGAGYSAVPENVKVIFAGSDVYVGGLFADFPDSWIKGTISGTTATFQGLQYVGDYQSYHIWVVGADNMGVLQDSFTMTFDATANTLTLDPDQFILANASDTEMYYLTYYSELTIMKDAPAPAQVDELPYSNDFSTTALQKEFSIINANGDGVAWMWYSEMARIAYAKPNDDWLVSPMIKLEAGKLYALSFQAHCQSSSYPETLEVKIAKENTAAALAAGTELMPATEIPSTTFQAYGNEGFTVDESGYYFIGIHNISYDSYYCYVDDFAIECKGEEVTIEETTTWNFDDGNLAPWTNIDADGDGYKWYVLTNGNNSEIFGHNGSYGWATSASYSGKALTPDNYLVSPKVKLGGKIKFFACAQDASWPGEHFGVAVSTTGNKNAADFTTIWEATMTAAPAMAPAPKGSNRTQGAWYEYEVDLSDYAGQEGYVAIRHFNCSDFFRLNVDDITIEMPIEYVDVTINNLEPGSITDAITAAAGTNKIKDVNIKLKNGDYTIEAPIVASGNVVIDGANGTIDASGLADPFLSLNAEPVIEANSAGAFPIDNITFKNVTIANLKNSLVKSNNLYLVQKLLVDNCIIGIKGASKKTIFDFSGVTGGNVIELAVTKSTLWADDATQWQNGGFFSTQSSKKLNQLGVENPQQLTSITNSTFYNIAKGKTTSTLIQNSQSWQVYEVYDNIIVNSGKSGQFCVGLNGGQQGKVENWNVDGNTFMFDGTDVSATESEKIKGGISESVIGDPGFADAANGDFTVGEQAEQQLTRTGDPRWLGQYMPDHVTAPIELTPLDGSNLTEVLAEAYVESLAPAYITINLLPGGHYTVSDPMEINATFSIIGDEANPATVDLGDCSGAMVQFSSILAPAFTVNDYGFWEQPFNVLFKNVIFSNVKKQLFYANKQPYLIEFFDFQNCIAEYRGGNKTVFDFNGGGVVENLTINNSTIYGNSFDGKHTGPLFSSQSGKNITDAVPGGKQKFTITNSTLFNIANGKNTMELRTKGKDYLVFTVKNNVIIDCGKNHQFSQGLNGGQPSNAPTFFVHYNSFMRTTADRTLIDDVEETTGDTEEVVTASWLNTYPETPIVDIFPKWFEQDEIGQYNNYFRGNFTVAEGSVQKTNSVGDPRWLRNDNEYTDIQGIAAEKAAEGEWYTVQGVRVDQPTKGLYIHNGKKVVIK